MRPTTIWIALVAMFALQPVRAEDPPSEGFPVEIRIDAGQSLGELRRYGASSAPTSPTTPHERRREAARRRSANWRPERFISAPTTCSPPATARPRSSGAARMRTPRMPTAIRSTTGRSSIASSTPTWSAACARTSQIGFMPKALSSKPEPYQHELDARVPVRGRSTPAGPTRRRITPSGASWSTSG